MTSIVLIIIVCFLPMVSHPEHLYGVSDARAPFDSGQPAVAIDPIEIPATEATGIPGTLTGGRLPGSISWWFSQVT